MATLETAMTAAQDTLEGLEEKVDDLKGENADFTMATKTLIKNKPTPSERSFEPFMKSC